MSHDVPRGRLLGSVPISIAAHFAVLIVLLIIPLAADVVMPDPERTVPQFVPAAPVPPPPAFVPAAPRPWRVPAPSLDVAPTIAPPSIQPEPSDVSSPRFDVPMGPPGGLPAAIGDVGGVSPPVAPSADAPRANLPVRAAQLPQPPRKIVDVRPVYPDLARNARVEGTVILEAVIDTGGAVTALRVVRSVPLLDQAALDAVRQWRYTPSVYGGRPVSVLLTITMRFTINQ